MWIILRPDLAAHPDHKLSWLTGSCSCFWFHVTFTASCPPLSQSSQFQWGPSKYPVNKPIFGNYWQEIISTLRVYSAPHILQMSFVCLFKGCIYSRPWTTRLVKRSSSTSSVSTGTGSTNSRPRGTGDSWRPTCCSLAWRVRDRASGRGSDRWICGVSLFVCNCILPFLISCHRQRDAGALRRAAELLCTD